MGTPAGCNGVCYKYEVMRTPIGHYAAGHKRCIPCGIWLIWEGMFCPCCGIHLRTKPRNSGFKKKFEERTGKGAKTVD